MRQGGTVSPASTHAVFPHLQRDSPVFGAFWPDLTVIRLSTSLLCVANQTDGDRSSDEPKRIRAEVAVDGIQTTGRRLRCHTRDRSDEMRQPLRVAGIERVARGSTPDG